MCPNGIFSGGKNIYFFSKFQKILRKIVFILLIRKKKSIFAPVLHSIFDYVSNLR